MRKPRDTIAKPRAGRFFPYSAWELATQLRSLSLKSHYSDERLDIMLQNCEVECPLGYQLRTFFPRTYMAEFSLPDVVPTGLARKAVEVALDRFRQIDAEPSLSLREQ